MKKEYQKVLLDSAKLIGKIPRVNITGATATASAYVSAYRDYSEACNLLGIITQNIEAIKNAEKVIQKYQHQEDYDTEEMKYSVQCYIKAMNKAYKELKEFIAERESQNWN